MNNLDETLDPKDWSLMRDLGHQMIEDVMDYLQKLDHRPVWQKIPTKIKETFKTPLPQKPTAIESVYQEFKTNVLPYTKGNIHPRFFAWVQGTGTPLGVLADMLASAMNPNVSIGEHSPRYVENQVIEWCKEMLNYPGNATGILLSGGSMANTTALIVARNNRINKDVRKKGLRTVPNQMVLYCSTETHVCVQKAAEVLGLGTEAVRKISVDEKYQINIDELVLAIESDIAVGMFPFCIVGNAGTVQTGAIDPLDELAKICNKYNLWLHIDGAFGALAKLVPEYAQQLKAIEKADSVAFDLHKWMYMPYESACVLIKNGQAHRDSFAATPNYLLQEGRGLGGGPEPVSNYGIELSRGFKALKIWMCLKEHGIEKYAEIINKNIRQAFYLGNQVELNANLELLTPVTLNIVCFRYIKNGIFNEQLNELNKEILVQLQLRGIASPSSTILDRKYAIRVCIVNQRTKQADIDLLIKEILKIGNELTELT